MDIDEINNVIYLLLLVCVNGTAHRSIEMHMVIRSNLYTMLCKKKGLKKINEAHKELIKGVDLIILYPMIEHVNAAISAEKI